MNRCDLLINKLIHPFIRVLGRNWSSFKLCGLIAVVCAVALCALLITKVGLSLWVLARIVLAVMLTFLGLAMATKLMTGIEKLTYYHHLVAVLVVVSILLRLSRLPILPYLDITILGMGTLTIIGRVGCLMAGCCHGRPHRWGVRYRDTHVAVGFPPHFVGVNLLPVQAFESLWALGAVAVGSTLVYGGSEPGETLSCYLLAYAVGRFVLEFFRGDGARSYFWGFSEAQWISLFVVLTVAAAGAAGWSPFRWWHGMTAASLALAMGTLAVTSRLNCTSGSRLLQAKHVEEMAETLFELSLQVDGAGTMPSQNCPESSILMACTSLGVRMSVGHAPSPAGPLKHYALSLQDRPMSVETARLLGSLIARLRHSEASIEIKQGNSDVFHLLVHPSIDTGGG
jgi:hypothetical protein